MVPLNTLVTHSLLYGVALSALLSVLIVATLLFRPMIWINDAPAQLRAVAGPINDTDRRLQRLTGAAVLILLVVFPVLALVGLRPSGGDAPAFAQAALSSFIVLMTFNTVDLVLLDWLVVERWGPGRIVVPGAPGVNFTRGDAYHFRGFLIGTVLSLGAAAVIAAVATLVW